MSSTESQAKAPEAVSGSPYRRLRWLDPGIVVILLVFAVYATALIGLGVFSPLTHRIAGVDPVGYYAWTHSLLFDRDLQFANEYRTLNAGATFTEGFLMNPDGPRTETGHLPNLFSVGPGILWMPFVAVAHGYAVATGASMDGFSQPYQSSVFIANAVYGLLGLVLTYRCVRTWFAPFVSAFAALAAWTCSPALYYTFAQIAMAHACSFFTIALLLFVWARLRLQPGLWPWVLLGLILGLSALVRWQNAAFAVVPAVDLLYRRRIQGLAPLAWCATMSIVAFAPQMIAWKILYGSFLTVPQGDAFVAWAKPHLGTILFSSASGLITWTPWCAVAVVGLFIWPRDDRVRWIVLALALLVQVYIDSVVPAAGWSFGTRRLVNCTPLFALGFAQVFHLFPVRKHWPVAITTVFAFWNFLFVLQYGGFIDRFYMERAVTTKAAELQVSVPELVAMTELPDGQSFDIRRFTQEHRFPRGSNLSFRQLTVDKLVVLRFLIERLSPVTAPS